MAAMRPWRALASGKGHAPAPCRSPKRGGPVQGRQLRTTRGPGVAQAAGTAGGSAEQAQYRSVETKLRGDRMGELTGFNVRNVEKPIDR